MPQAPVLVFDEGFENTGGAAIPLPNYVGTSGDTYTAGGGGGGYADITVCNGTIMTGNTGLPIPPYCQNAQPPQTPATLANITATMRAFATILGGMNGLGANNHALVNLTAFNEVAPLAAINSVNPVTFPVQTNRFIGYSINVTADCGPAAPTQPVLVLETSTQVTGGWAPCQHGGGTGATLSTGASLFTGTQVGWQVINYQTGGYTGNDFGLDDFKVLDETPQLDKAFNPAVIKVGQTSALTFTITNTNDLNDKNGWGFTDTLPTGVTIANGNATTTCPAASITALTGTTSVVVTGGDIAAGQSSCTVTVDVTAPEGHYLNGPANVIETSLNPPGSAPLTVNAPHLDTVKTLLKVNGVNATPTTEVKPGDVLIYNVTTTNTGGADGSATLSDTVPANTTYAGSGEGWSCSSGAVAGTPCTQSITVLAGSSVPLTYTDKVVAPLPSGTTTIANQLTSTGEKCSSCNPATPTIAVLDTVKTLSTVNGKAADANTQVGAGDVLVYKLTTTNTGGSTGTTTLSDTVPPNTTYAGTGEGWSCAAGASDRTACTQDVTVPASQSVTVTYTDKVNSALPANTTTVANQATSSGGTCSNCFPTSATDPVLDTVKALATVNGKAADASTAVGAGDVLVYRLTTTNTGGSTGTSTLSDTVPPNTTYAGTGEGWSCSVGAAAGKACTQDVSVDAGGSVTVTYTDKVVSPLPANTTSIANQASSPGGTCSSCSPTQPTLPVLDTVKTLSTVNGKAADATTEVGAGDVLVYKLTTANTGGSTGTSTLSDTVPTNTTYTGTGEGWSCKAGSASGTACKQDVTVAAGQSVTVTYTDTVVKVLPANTTTVANQAASTGGTCSACAPSQSTEAVLNTVKALAKVNGATAGSGTKVKAGDVLVYKLTTTNTGGSDGTTTLSDTVPANTTYTGTGEGWSCKAGAVAGTACKQTLDVAAGKSVTVTYTDTVADPLPSGATTIANEATSSTGGCASCSPSNTVAHTSTPVSSSPSAPSSPAAPSSPSAGLSASSLHLVKKAAVDDRNHNRITDAGDTVTYTFVVTNTGNVALTDIKINDAMLSAVRCPDETLKPGEREICTGSPYTIADADSGAGHLTNAATATGVNPHHKTVSSNHAKVTITTGHVEQMHPHKIVSDLGTPSGEAAESGSLAGSGLLYGLGALMLLASLTLRQIARASRHHA